MRSKFCYTNSQINHSGIMNVGTFTDLQNLKLSLCLTKYDAMKSCA